MTRKYSVSFEVHTDSTCFNTLLHENTSKRGNSSDLLYIWQSIDHKCSHFFAGLVFCFGYFEMFRASGYSYREVPPSIELPKSTSSTRVRIRIRVRVRIRIRVRVRIRVQVRVRNSMYSVTIGTPGTNSHTFYRIHFLNKLAISKLANKHLSWPAFSWTWTLKLQFTSFIGKQML